MSNPVNLNFSKQLNRRYELDDALYELVANAIDANNGSAPEISSPNTDANHKFFIDIKDSGNGINRNHFIHGVPSQPGKNGFNGIGLKDAIAVTMRNNVSMEIETIGNTYKFGEYLFGDQADAIPTIGYTSKSNDRMKGTTIHLTGGHGDSLKTSWEKCWNRFLLPMHSGNPRKKDDYVSQYKWPEGVPRDRIYLNGVAKTVPGNLDFMYDFKSTSEMKNEIDRDHRFTKKGNKLVRTRIINLDPNESGWWSVTPRARARARVPVLIRAPPPPPPLPPVVPVANSCPPVQPQNTMAPPVKKKFVPAIQTENSSPHAMELYNSLFDALSTQNHPLITNTAKEVGTTKAAVEELIKEIKKKLILIPVTVAEVGKSGSLEKNSSVPGYADADVVLRLNDFDSDLYPKYRKAIEDAVKTCEGYVEPGPPEKCAHCHYKGRRIDIVLADVSCEKSFDPEEYERAFGGADSVDETKATVGINNYGYEVMRAVKYLVARLGMAPSGEVVKSYVIEKLVLEQFEKLQTESGHPVELSNPSEDVTKKRQYLFYCATKRLCDVLANKISTGVNEAEVNTLMRDADSSAKEQLLSELNTFKLSEWSA